MFYKQPSRPVRIKTEVPSGLRCQSGTLYDIMNPGEYDHFTFVKGPVYMEEIYLRLLKKNNDILGIPFIDPMLPKSPPFVPPAVSQEPELDVPDRVYLKLRVLKNGIVRVKLCAAMWDLYETYYQNVRKPPFKTVLQACKSHGFSTKFIERLKKNNEKQLTYAKKLPDIFQKIFDKEPVKKVKKEKKKEPVVDVSEEVVDVSEEPEEDVVEEEEVPADEGELDVEPDEEEAVEEEEYVSDGDD